MAEQQNTQILPIDSPTLQRVEPDFPMPINPFAQFAVNDTMPKETPGLVPIQLPTAYESKPIMPAEPAQQVPQLIPQPQPEMPEPEKLPAGKMAITTTTQKKVPSPEEIEARKQQQQILKKQEKIVQEQTALARMEAEERSQKAEAELIAAKDYDTELKKIQTQTREQMDAYKAQMDAQFAELQKMDIKDYWSNRTIGDRVTAGIAVALGAVGAAFTGGKNVAYDIINNAIAADYKRQQAAINLKRQALEQTGRMSMQVRNNFALAESFLANKKAAAYAKAESLLKQNLAKLGPDKVTIDQKNLLNQLQAKQNEERIKAEQSLRTVVTQTAKPFIDETKKLTDERRINFGLKYLADDVTKKTKDMRSSYMGIQSAASRTGGAADMALIFSFMKLLDPGSVVREGEFLTAKKTASIPDYVWDSYQKLTQGGIIGPQTRTRFLKEAEGKWKAQLKSQKILDKEYKQIADTEGINLDSYFVKPIAPEETQTAAAVPLKSKDGKFIMRFSQIDKATGKKKTYKWSPMGYQEIGK